MTSGKLGFSYFPNLNENRQCEFRFPQFGARERGGYGLLKTMSGNTKDKIAVCNNAGKTTPAATAPMANAYANATVLEKIENFVATFRHWKCNERSSRFSF